MKSKKAEMSQQTALIILAIITLAIIVLVIITPSRRAIASLIDKLPW